MIEIIAYLIVAIVMVLWYHLKLNNRKFEKLVARMPGLAPSYPTVGIGLRFIGSAKRK